jgi:hypothetical protein
MVYDTSLHQVDSAGFTLLGGQIINIGLKDMCGCTALFVVHPTAIYYAHYFEDPSFNDMATFQTNVANYLKGVTPSPGLGDGFPSLQAHQNIFNNDQTRVFILTPRAYDARTANTAEYDPMVTQLERTVQDLLQNAPNPTRYLYNAPNSGTAHGRNLMATTVRGRALFEYDPADNPQMRLFFQTDRQI